MTGTQSRGMTTMHHRSGLPIDPRFQARMVEVQRDLGRRRLRFLKRAVLAALVLAGLWGLSRSPLLAVRRIVVDGAAHTGRAAALSVTGLDRHDQMLDLRPARLRGQLRALPWIEDVSVRRHWPTTVKLVVRERVPVAQLPGSDGQPALVDAGGRVLAAGREASAVLAAQRPALPVLEGLPRAPIAGRVLGADAHGALALAATVPHALAEPAVPGAPSLSTTSVAVMPDGTLTIGLSPGVVVVFGSSEQLPAKLLALRTVLAHLGSARQVTIDVRVADSPVLTEGSSRSIVSTIQRG